MLYPAELRARGKRPILSHWADPVPFENHEDEKRQGQEEERDAAFDHRQPLME